MDLGPCPACGSEDHEVLREAAGHTTLRCTECGHVRTEAPRKPRHTDLALVLSDGHRSWSDRILVPDDEPVAVGDEFDHEGSRWLVTGVERTDGHATASAPAAQLRTCFAKRFDQVVLKVSVNEGEVTRSYEEAVDPERPVHIGEVLQVQERLLVVKTLKSDQNRTLHRGFLLARNVRRVFCDPAPPKARPGAVMAVRRRGAGKPAAKGDGRRAPGTGARKAPSQTGGSKTPGRTGGSRSPDRASGSRGPRTPRRR